MDNEHNICDSKPNDGDDEPEDEYTGDNINEQWRNGLLSGVGKWT